jgi:tripartite-type tricarboxylate transporter receptor subunit TctC
MKSRSSTLTISIAVVVLAFAADVLAQSRPVRLLVTFPPGGATDISARMLAPRLSEGLGQQVVVDNRPGASGMIATALLARAAPDGHTILVVDVAHGANPALNDKMPYDTLKDLSVVSLLLRVPMLLLVNPAFPAQSVKELVALARSKPGQMSFSSSGIYGALHMPMEMFLHAAKLKMRHVPTTGGGPAITAVLGGHVEMTAGGPAAISGHVKAGKMRPIVSWGGKRHEAYPEIPTFKELGYDIEYYIWAGMFAPSGTSEAVMKVLRDAARKTVEDPDFKKTMANVNSPIQYMDAPEFAKYWEADGRRLAALVKVVGKVEAQK